MDSIEFDADDSKVTISHFDQVGMVMGYTSIPLQEWQKMRERVKEHYNSQLQSRKDCINLVTALTIGIEAT